MVAEAQNLAGDTAYVRRLKAATQKDRISRLHWNAPATLGIGPWDDGTLKLAVTVCLAWTSVVTISAVLERRALVADRRWPERQPRRVTERPVGRGLEANTHRDETSPDRDGGQGRERCDSLPGRQCSTSSLGAPASPVYLNRVAWLFDSTDLLFRFPTVARAVAANPDWLKMNRNAKVFYACHAASMAATPA